MPLKTSTLPASFELIKQNTQIRKKRIFFMMMWRQQKIEHNWNDFLCVAVAYMWRVSVLSNKFENFFFSHDLGNKKKYKLRFFFVFLFFSLLIQATTYTNSLHYFRLFKMLLFFLLLIRAHKALAIISIEYNDLEIVTSSKGLESNGSPSY